MVEAVAAWRRHRLRPRVLRDVSRVETGLTLLGTKLSDPILVAPTAFHVITHEGAEVEMARGVQHAGGLMVVATRSTSPLEEIAAALQAPWWFQVYVVRERRITMALVQRAAALGAAALVLTGDTPYLSRRRHGASMPPLTTEEYLGNFAAHLEPDAELGVATAQDPSITFDMISELREVSGLPVLVKGVLRGDDAAAAIAAGAAGVIVSNHGGRQLDRAVASAVALPEVVAAVGGRGEVLVDGGIRSGIDVLVALALGARAVLVGRPLCWALAAGGARQVALVLGAFRSELTEAMALAGTASLSEVDGSLLSRP